MFGHQPGALQRLFHEGVTEPHAVLATGELMEMPDVETLVAIAIQREHALKFGHRGPLRRRPPAAAIEQAVITLMLEPPPQPPDAARAAPKDVGRLGPRELAVESAKDHFLDLHGTLHSAARIGHGHLLGGYSSHTARQERSCHSSLPSGQLTYLQHEVGVDA